MPLVDPTRQPWADRFHVYAPVLAVSRSLTGLIGLTGLTGLTGLISATIADVAGRGGAWRDMAGRGGTRRVRRGTRLGVFCFAAACSYVGSS